MPAAVALRTMPAVIGLLRSLFSLVVVAALVWCSFRVPLGERTFAEHADRIGETPEARELLDSTRQTLTPMLQDATDRMLGEYIEAPTEATTLPSSPPATPPATPPKTVGREVPARTVAPGRGRLPRASPAPDEPGH